MADMNTVGKLKVLQPQAGDDSTYVNPVTVAKAVSYNGTSVQKALDSLQEQIDKLTNQSISNITNVNQCIEPNRIYSLSLSGTDSPDNSSILKKWIIWAFPGDNMIVQYASAENGSVFIRTGIKENDSEIYTFSSWIKNLSLNEIYPVGSIYITLTETSPETIVGGTWSLLEEGMFLRSGGEELKTSGGELQTGGTSTLTLTAEQLPPHKHLFQKDDYSMTWGTGQNINVWLNVLAYSGIQQTGNFLGCFQGLTNDGLGSRATSEFLFGAGQPQVNGQGNPVPLTQKPINIEPSYVNVYMWRRVA